MPARAEICVVGGGYTGLWTALQLKRRRPDADIVLIEADICGAGASGRNGGFVMSSWSKFGSLQKLAGTEEALRFCRASEAAIGSIEAFCERRGINAEFSRRGWLWVATNESQLDAWTGAMAALGPTGAMPFVRLEPEQVASRTGSSAHLAGLFEAGCATVHPARLARGLARAAREAGVQIHERTTMLSLTGDAPITVGTSRGSLVCDQVVLATNAWAAAMPELRHAIVVVTSDVVATEPAPDRLAAIGWEAGVAISDSRRMVNYYQRRDDGTVVFGKGGGALSFRGSVPAWMNGPSARAEVTLAQLRRLYPDLADVPERANWCGPIDYSVTGLPFVARIPGRPNVLVGAGFSGNGIGPSYLAGEALASMAEGEGADPFPRAMRRVPRAKFPPEPLRYLGGRLVRSAIERKEDAEDAGRRPGPLIGALAGLDPTGGLVDRG
jgi:glycine/D-amino acid oxidase-like deaminating enzyme